ncbi:alpha- -mannosyltransferase [Ophiostoma piceae UAMH 11346]|uniref:Alpha--mannosyltransferase n=1 Tax=Ophiostoma piceae (strain UAMH 11346) TaxID=1262450 RepID=S3CV79_OPHP1|nr:alpha- -mannosyltransferase [Ophiostoma piceae UAMH 11346]
MAPPHLHPRSRMTSSLFATTVFASFFVVVLPHILPCPAPRVTLSDGQMTVAEDGTVLQPQRRRRRRRIQDEVMDSAQSCVEPAEVKRGEDGIARFAMVNAVGAVGAGEKSTAAAQGDVAEAYTESAASFAPGPRRATRECPVPKPGGIVGELLGFKSSEGGHSPQPHQTPLPPQPQAASLEDNR